MARGNGRTASRNGGGDLGFERKLWLAADKLRGNVDAAEYKHVVLGLIFLKYVSDAFQERYAQVVRVRRDPEDVLLMKRWVQERLTGERTISARDVESALQEVRKAESTLERLLK